MLRVEDVHAFYCDSHILHGVTLEVGAGEIVCLIGRNGVGKTTLLRAIMGLVHVRGGAIRLDGRDLTGLAPHRIAHLGIGWVPEGRGIFAGLTVAENLKLGVMGRRAAVVPAELYEFFPILRERAGQAAESLSGGEQQILAIARGLAGRPALLLIDEFSEGLQPSIVQQIAELLRSVNRTGVAILFVEQNARLALALAERGYIMEKGQIVHHGPSAALLADEDALRRHLVI